MPSPFPGMDPYLEGYLWSDVHNALANKIRQQLTPKLRPRYTVRLEIYLIEDTNPEAEIGILYPDPDIPLALATALSAIYDEAAYDLSINYSQLPPPPPMSASDLQWMQNLLAKP